MAQESAIIDLLSAQQREWRGHFPALINRAQQVVVGYLCTRGRNGVPVYALYGRDGAPQILSEILSVREVRDALAKL